MLLKSDCMQIIHMNSVKKLLIEVNQANVDTKQKLKIKLNK